MNEKEKLTMWTPSEQEQQDCMNGKSCSFGICSECSMTGGNNSCSTNADGGEEAAE